ncbi:MAG: transporter, partial [Tardiphaga sp.]|nr:transporter [Tardiphaga sp.]
MSEPRWTEISSRVRRHIRFACGAMLLTWVGSIGAFAQNAALVTPETYPTKTIRYIVPYTPGGFNDTLGRIVAQKLQETWGVPVVVENRPGGGTLIGTEAVAKAAPDGYTLLGVAFPFGANPSIYRHLPYDTVADFTPLILAGQTPNLLVVKPSLPINSIKDLRDYVKANPGKVSYGSTGIGSSNHLSMELFKSLTGLEIVHVPYKGSAPMVNDMLGGHIDVAFDNVPNVLQQVNAGKLRALGVSSTERSPLAESVPTLAEAGVANYEVSVWFGVVAPANTPPDIVKKLNAE